MRDGKRKEMMEGGDEGKGWLYKYGAGVLVDGMTKRDAQLAELEGVIQTKAASD